MAEASNPMAGFSAADWKNVLDLIGEQKAEIERLRARLEYAADWLERSYGALPSNAPPGPPTSLVAYLRGADETESKHGHEGR